jgi:hypothetical protein
MEEIIKKLGISDYTITEDGLVDVDGDVHLSCRGLQEIPVAFGKVTGSFYCDNNEISVLNNIPTEVGRDFWFHNNPIENPREQSEKLSLRERVVGVIAYSLNLEEWWNEAPKATK